MSQVNITPVHGVEIESLRHNVAVATESAYGAMRKYAEGLCSVLPAEWYLVEHNDSSDNAKPVHAEKKALFAELKAVNHSNPSTIWARVRKYAQEHIEGAPEQFRANAGEGESVGKRETRSLELRLVEDLTALWKACGRAESLSDKQSQCKTHIGSALTAMGVDLSLIK
jgi:hypothetical protein